MTMMRLLLLWALGIACLRGECITAPVAPGCDGDIPQTLCFFEGLWLIDGQFFAPRSSLPASEVHLHEGHAGDLIIRAMDPRRHARMHAQETWAGVLSVIHHRIFPHCYAHMLRDTLPQDLYAFRRFQQATWDVPTVRQNLRALYLDGQTTTHPLYRIHSHFPPWERTQTSITHNMYFERAVVGHWGYLPLDRCQSHFFSPDDWDAYAGFIARAALPLPLPERDPALVWIANRNRGETREFPGGETLAIDLTRLGFRVITTRPAEIPAWEDQLRLARQASVILGPHGSNLANAILAGRNVTVLELLARERLSGWYYQQCVYQGARWVSYPDHPPAHLSVANASALAPLLRRLLQSPHWTPACRYGFYGPFQICG